MAVEHELERRRLEEFLRSLANPHPEAAERADGGLGDWTGELPDDEGLLDMAEGTAVKWLEGQGWVRETA